MCGKKEPNRPRGHREKKGRIATCRGGADPFALQY